METRHANEKEAARKAGGDEQQQTQQRHAEEIKEYHRKEVETACQQAKAMLQAELDLAKEQVELLKESLATQKAANDDATATGYGEGRDDAQKEFQPVRDNLARVEHQLADAHKTTVTTNQRHATAVRAANDAKNEAERKQLQADARATQLEQNLASKNRDV